MKYKIPKYLIFFLLLFYTSSIKAYDKFYYLDMDYIMNNSLAGKSITNQLKKISQINIDTFKKKEQDLKTEESKIIIQKKILDKNEYQKKVILFKNKISDFNKNKKNANNILSKKRVEAHTSLLKTLTPIIIDYAKENSVSVIMDKKNIIVGKNELDITKTILKILDTKIKNIKLN